jgi:hypothetical protein
MDIRVIEGRDEEWDRFVWDSPGGTIFHTTRFLSYHPPERFSFVNLAVHDNGELVCVLPGGSSETEPSKIFKSPVGASFGGFIFRDDCSLAAMNDIITAATERIRDMGFEGVEMVLPPICYSQHEHQSLHYVLTSTGYRPGLREATLVVPLAAVDEEHLHPVLARNLRRSRRDGVDVRVSDRFGDFYEVLSRNLSLKKVKPTHSLDELTRLRGLFPEKMILLEAVLEGEVVGGCLLVLCNGRVGLAFYICDDPERRQSRVSESVLFHSMQRLRGEGYAYFDLGTVSRGGQPDWGLVRFKSKFSPRTYVRESYSLVFGEAQS